MVPLFPRLLLLLLTLAAGFVAAVPGHAQLRLDVTKGRAEALPIAIVPFADSSGDLGSRITQVVRDDLERSGLFRVVAPGNFAAGEGGMDTDPAWGAWQSLKAQALVKGRVVPDGQGGVRTEFRLYDVFSETLLDGKGFAGRPADWRRLGHKTADAIYERLTGDKGYFDSQVAYIAESGPARQRVKRLAIMDQDGANVRYLTDGRQLVLTPRFAPDGRTLAYIGYVDRKPQLLLLDLGTGQTRSLGRMPGLSFAPRFSPDGRRLVFSMARDGNTDIFVTDLASGRTQRLTRDPAIDTSPSFSPDGRRIVFNSDRGGSQQLYVMNAGGGGGQRISFGDGRYATPVWSPRGDYIAFTRMSGGTFYIGVMAPDGSGERMLAQGYLVEGPTWAPNGRVIMFFQEGRGAQGPSLAAVDVTGRHQRRVPTPTSASDPAWSPLRP